jgi:ornithine cyclodeaminase
MATRRLAREDAAVLAIIGAGVQARMHFRAMRAVRPVEAVRVWSPRRETAEALAQEIEEEYALSTRVCADAEEAVRPADLVCTVTRATSPVVKGAWLAHGVHVNAIGSHTADARELDSNAVAGARVFVDSLEGALLAGDLCVPLEEGRIAPHHVVGEIGEVLAGTKPGRLSDEDVTVYKSVGIAVQDVAAALFVFANARRSGRGVEVQL